MKVTINNKEYDMEDMDKDQRASVNELQSLDKIIKHLSMEVTIRQVSISSLIDKKNNLLDPLVKSLDGNQPSKSKGKSK